jgi:hypothetical protein
MAEKFFVTFGYGMPLQGKYALIPGAKTDEAARATVAKVYGMRWSFIYPMKDLAGQVAQFPIEAVEWGTPNMDPPPLCTGCNKHPAQIDEYVDAAEAEAMTPDEYVTKEEGTFNYSNGHFHCTACYIAAGSPSAPGGWQAP